MTDTANPLFSTGNISLFEPQPFIGDGFTSFEDFASGNFSIDTTNIDLAIDPTALIDSGFDIGGGQSATFINRSRLINRNSRSTLGRSVFSKRNALPRPVDSIRALFR